MRSVVAKTLAVVLVAVTAFGFVAPAVASAQDANYPPIVPAPVPNPNLSGDEILAVINANNAAAAAANAAAGAANAANRGDGAAAAAAAVRANAYADKAAAILKDAKKAGFQTAAIARIEAASNAAAASAAAADAAAKSAAATPLAVSVPVPNLAFTGSSVNLPVALGALMVGAGGLTLLAARKRELAQR